MVQRLNLRVYGARGGKISRSRGVFEFSAELRETNCTDVAIVRAPGVGCARQLGAVVGLQ